MSSKKVGFYLKSPLRNITFYEYIIYMLCHKTNVLTDDLVNGMIVEIVWKFKFINIFRIT